MILTEASANRFKEERDMRMNEVIQERRRALGMPQEQVADALGVTVPAVNKWERGVAYS